MLKKDQTSRLSPCCSQPTMSTLVNWSSRMTMKAMPSHGVMLPLLELLLKVFFLVAMF